MIIKILGALLVIAGCVSFSMLMSKNLKTEVRTLRQLISALDFMENELQYRRTTLPQLCRMTAEVIDGSVSQIFKELANELDNQIAPDAQLCMQTALNKFGGHVQHARTQLLALGRTLGRFNLEGQIYDLQMVRNECSQKVTTLTQNLDQKLRNLRALCICTGVAIIIVLI